MNLIKTILLIVAVVVMVACNKTSLDKLVIPKDKPVTPKSDTGKTISDTGKGIKVDTNTFILRTRTDNYYVKKGYITFKTPDTTFTLTAPKDSIWFAWYTRWVPENNYKPYIALRTSIYTWKDNGVIDLSIDVPDTLKSNSTYNVYDFNYSSYKKQGDWAWQDYLHLSEGITLKLDQYNTPPVLAKGTFSGSAQRTYKQDKNYIYKEEKVTGEFYLELRKK